jgi:hypothetical protein
VEHAADLYQKALCGLKTAGSSFPSITVRQHARGAFLPLREWWQTLQSQAELISETLAISTSEAASGFFVRRFPHAAHTLFQVGLTSQHPGQIVALGDRHAGMAQHY